MQDQQLLTSKQDCCSITFEYHPHLGCSCLNRKLPYVCHEAFHSGCADIDTVDAVTNETPVGSFKVLKNHQGKLFQDGIKEALANRGLVLLGIGEDAFPAHKDGWTIMTFNTSPVQLIVGPKPGMDTTLSDLQFRM